MQPPWSSSQRLPEPLARRQPQTTSRTPFSALDVWTLRGDLVREEGDDAARLRFGPWVTVTATFFLSELGDGADSPPSGLSPSYGKSLGVRAGSTLGMVAADALAIFAGIVMVRRLPERAIRRGATAFFLTTEADTLAGAFGTFA